MGKPGPKSYRINGYLTISVVKIIEANSKQEAVDKAWELSAPTLLDWRSSGRIKAVDDEWEFNGFDDPPEDLIIDVHVEEKEE